MNKHNTFKLKDFFVALAFTALAASIMAAAAHGQASQSTLKALGESHKQRFRELKRLGPNATPEQIHEVNRRAYERVAPQLNAEMMKKKMNMAAAFGMFNQKLNERMARNAELRKQAKEEAKAKGLKDWKKIYREKKLSLAKNGAAGGASAASAAGGESPAAGTGSGSRGVSSTTGEVTGADGAKAVDYLETKKEEPQYKMLDGIIQEQ